MIVVVTVSSIVYSSPVAAANARIVQVPDTKGTNENPLAVTFVPGTIEATIVVKDPCTLPFGSSAWNVIGTFVAVSNPDCTKVADAEALVFVK